MSHNKLFALFVVLAVILTACSPVSTPVPTTAPTEENLHKLTVPLGWLNNDEWVALHVAQDNGYFEDENLEVTLVSGGGSTGFDPIKAIQGFDESIRIGAPAGLSVVLKAKAQGADVIAVAALLQREPSGFLTLIEDGRQSESPCDFKNKVVAQQPDSTWYVDALGSQCQEGPLTSGEDFTVVPAGWTPDCLSEGSCDYYCAWSTNQPFFFEQQGLEEGVDYEMFLTADYLPFYYVDVVITTSQFANEHPNIVRGFVNAAVKGLQFTLDNPDDAVEITASREAVSLEHAAWRIPPQNDLAVSKDTKEHGLGYMDPTKVQEMIDFLYEHDQLESHFNAEEVIDNSFLP
jgi:NitT/TauT family transport system substrate-binding protein